MVPRASAVLHLLLGAALYGLALAPMLFVWYPRPLFTAAGSARIALLVAVIGVLLGPALAALLARTGKRGLKAIAAAQLLVLAGCALTLYLQRPVYLVFTIDRFDLVLAKDLDPRDLAKASEPEFARRPLTGPRYVAALPPGDPAMVQRILDQALGGGKDLQMHPQHYVPYAGQAQRALGRAKPIAVLNGRDVGALARFEASTGRSGASVRFLPLRAPNRDGIVLLDAQSGMPLGILLVDPW